MEASHHPAAPQAEAVARPACLRPIAPAPAAERRHPADLEPVAVHWQRALDADYRALHAVEGILPSTELSPRLYNLARERTDVELLLARLARTTGAHPLPGWRRPA